jgi:hypothetical protein
MKIFELLVAWMRKVYYTLFLVLRSSFRFLFPLNPATGPLWVRFFQTLGHFSHRLHSLQEKVVECLFVFRISMFGLARCITVSGDRVYIPSMYRLNGRAIRPGFYFTPFGELLFGLLTLFLVFFSFIVFLLYYRESFFFNIFVHQIGITALKIHCFLSKLK